MQRFVAFLVAILALAACVPGEAGPAGKSCTVTQNADGSATITCEDGTTATILPGEAVSAGYDALLSPSAASSSDCPHGGQELSVGLDNGDGGGTARDGVLQAGEVDDTFLVCNGDPGTQGLPGAALLATVFAASTSDCPEGGQQVDVGLDNGDGAGTAGDGVLQTGEVDETFFSCTGETGALGLPGPPGDSCSVFNNCDGWSTVTCEDGSSATWWSGVWCSIAAGGAHNCGFDSTGNVQCWGNNDSGQSDVPMGYFVSLSSGGWHTCGIKKDKSVACWGAGATYSATCERTGGNYNCNQSRPPAGFYFKSLSAGRYLTCGITTTDTVRCWGEDVSGSLTPPAGTFVQVTSGDKFSCGLRASGQVECWGSMTGNLAVIPTDTFKAIAAGYDSVCGILADDSIKCWGLTALLVSGAPSTGSFRQLSTGGNHACAIKLSDDTLVCWGINDAGQGVASAGDASHRWQFVDAGGGHNCGMTMEGNFYCWGANPYGQATVPATFPGF